MTDNEIINGYFNWLKDIVSGSRFAKGVSFNKLLMRLHDIEFRYSILKDENRASDGINLRWRYALRQGDTSGYILEVLDGPCSVLEMMVALALRCEETIMDDPSIGDRTGQWFWGMITSLGLGSMRDDIFDKSVVDECIERFLNRDYHSNGRGGLFTVRNCDHDLRDVEIWVQLNLYLNTIT